MITIFGKQVFTTIAEIVDPIHCALLIVDVQNDFCSEHGHFSRHGGDVTDLKRVLPRIKTVIEEARTAGVLPIYVSMSHTQATCPSLRSGSGFKPSAMACPRTSTSNSRVAGAARSLTRSSRAQMT
jgi:nicotinamidase-related amidase